MEGLAIGAGCDQIISDFQPFVRSDIQINLLLGSNDKIKLLGQNNSSYGFAVGRHKGICLDVTEGWLFPFGEGYRDVSRDDLRATQFWDCNGGVVLNTDHADYPQLEINIACAADRGRLPTERLVVVGILGVAKDLKLVTFFEAGSMKVNAITQAGEPCLVRAIPSRDPVL